MTAGKLLLEAVAGLAAAGVDEAELNAQWLLADAMEVPRLNLLADPGQVREILHRGAGKAREKAAVTLDLVRDRVGLKY